MINFRKLMTIRATVVARAKTALIQKYQSEPWFRHVAVGINENHGRLVMYVNKNSSLYNLPSELFGVAIVIKETQC